MMLHVLLILGMVHTATAKIPTYNKDHIRESFHYKLNSEADLNHFLEGIQNEQEPFLMGYKGTVMTMMSEYLIAPWKKLKSFQEGKGLIEKAIVRDPFSVEMRYLRMLVQLKAPRFLGYNNNLDTDLEFLIANWSSSDISDKWKLVMLNNLVQLDGISGNNKHALKQLING